MKIAVPSADDRGLDSEVGRHFGRVPYYTIVSVEDDAIKEVEVVRNPFIEHQPGQIPSFLRQKGVDVIIAYGVGRRAREFFNALGISVITGAYGKVGEVVESYIRGSIRTDESWEEGPEFHRHKMGKGSRKCRDIW
ncbi:MAG: dinitrogenase iron-molybdenum cofactor [Thermoproteota archaeon]|nr:MAG: dinitrogenase iron-molybdenum cofactor [Candidatus Korarchaeota archaeon]